MSYGVIRQRVKQRVRTSVFMLTIVCFGVAENFAAAEPLNDIRILIDVSGSMKANDPHNLRVPALRLLTQLLPKGARSGVWTFGREVNMLVKRGDVDSAWKESAYKAAGEVHSYGLFTNIEGVLEDSTWDWTHPDEKYERTIIFLTDGLVDISTDFNKNQESRRRVLQKTLARLHDAGVVIHTIGLSEQVDKEFLQQLSASTDGWYEEVASAEQLERVFLRMFEKTVKSDTLPLVDNRILVDESVEELTLLVFRSENGAESELITPDGRSLTRHSERNGVRWRHEARYDLVTVDNPVSGEWQVKADVDPDNRVMVVTDLRLRTSRLPNIMLSSESHGFFAELLQEGEVIDSLEFLSLARLMLTELPAGGKEQRIVMADDGYGIDTVSHDGKFSAAVGGALTAGKYDYNLLVDSGTFKRSMHQIIEVVDLPVVVSVKEITEDDSGRYRLSVIPYTNIVAPESLLIDAMLSKAGGAPVAVAIPYVGVGEWRLEMDVVAGEIYEIALSIQGETRRGQLLNTDLGRYVFGQGKVQKTVAKREPESVKVPAKMVDEVGEAVDSHGEESLPEESPLLDDELVEEEVEAPTWWIVVLKVIVFNAIIIGAGYFGYRKWFKDASDKEAVDKSESEEERDDD